MTTPDAPGDVVDVRNPANGDVIESIKLSTPQDVDRAIERAQVGRTAWGRLSAIERREILLRFADAVSRQRDDLASLLCSEAGKPIAQAGWEVDTAIRLFTGYAERLQFFHGDSVPLDSQRGLERDLMLTLREPLGVVAAITPFNFPIDLFAHKVAPALAAGNSVIVKPDPRTPLTTQRMIDLLVECGIPDCAIQDVQGGAMVGQILSSASGIDAISLTGSTGAGREVASAAGRSLKRVFLELSGNDPLLVFPDADIREAVAAVRYGRLLANGQTCCATERVLVHESVADEFLSGLRESLNDIRMGDPSDGAVSLGPLIDTAAKDRLVAQVDALVAEGANRLTPREGSEGSFMSPVLLNNVSLTSERILTEERFGPVFVVQTFRSDYEAVDTVNRSKYALNAAVFTRDLDRTFKMAGQLEASSVMINATTLYRPDQMAFGGFKQSGMGREGILYTLEEMTRIKSIVVKNALNRQGRNQFAES